MLQRQSFDASFKVNVIKIPTMKDLVGGDNFSDDATLNPYLEQVLKDFSMYGFAIVEFDQLAYDEFPDLKKIFGTTSPHQKQDGLGRLIVDPLYPTSIGVATVDQVHMPHTDETYMPNPSKIVALACETPAASGGGVSTIISGMALYDHAKKNFPDRFKELYRPDVLSIRRSLLGTGYKEEHDLLSIFAATKASGRITIRWRSNDSYVEKIHPEAKSVYLSLCDFVMDEKFILKHYLKKNQLLIMDNSGVIHGRTIYQKGERRRLWRMNFYNDGILKKRMVCGLNPDEQKLCE